MTFRLLAASAIALAAAPPLAPALAQTAPAASATTGRLPTTAVPIHYDITIDPDAEKLTFTGSEIITIAVAKPTDTIVLNVAELTIGGAQLDGVPAQRITIDEAAQTLTLVFAEPIKPGAHQLAISFAGKINQSAAGLFATDYRDARGDQRMLVTQMEPADGRRFAPLWDEPAFKATFTLRAVTPRGVTSFSNMPIASEQKVEGGKTLVSFQRTPKMSSYLMFMGWGDVERKSRMVGNVEVGVITRKGALDQAEYALDAAARLLPYFNDYFGTPYPLPKLDMIAAPGSSQFFSAMENWGAILYFDRAVLLDPQLSTESRRQGIFNVVAHEIAHQWFGNIVTMNWWDDLWLNEGFASWMAAKASGDLNPEWNVPAQVAASQRQAAITVDARSSTHPIIQKIETVEQISQAFDAITYQKGQAVIRMLEGSVGQDAFRDGVRTYMKKYAYKNTLTDYLWSEVSAAAGRPVKPFMDTFTLQGGVPLIRAGEPSCVGGRTRVTLSQDRFGLDEPSKAARRWQVPVDLSTGGEKAIANVSGPNRITATAPGCGMLVVNPGQEGYYRTLYAPRHAAALTAGFARLSLADQVGLMGDNLALANGGYVGIERYLDLIDKLPADADPLVWNLAASQLSGIDNVLKGDPAQPAFRAKAARLLAPQWDRVGFRAQRGENPAVSQLREGLIGALGRFGDRRVIDGARKLLIEDYNDLPGSIREPVIGVVASSADAATWDRLRKLAQDEKNPSARASLYTALGYAEDPALQDRALALALTDEVPVPVRTQIIAAVAGTNPAKGFDWAVANAAQINALVEASARPRYLVGLPAGSNDAAVADRVDAYAKANLAESARAGANTSIAGIRARAKLRGAQAPAIAAWAAR